MIGRGEICNRKLENRFSACHIVRASVNAGCHCYQEGREEIGNQATMGKMKLWVVFRLNTEKRDLRFEPGGTEEAQISRVECCWEVRGNGHPEKMIWLHGGLWLSFEKMVSGWWRIYLSIQGRNPGVIFDTSHTTCPCNTHQVVLNLPSEVGHKKNKLYKNNW